MRVAWTPPAAVPAHLEQFQHAFATEVAGPCSMSWRIERTDHRARLALFVSRHGHCLYDILSRWESGEWAVEIPLIVSNHPELRATAEHFGIRYEVVPIDAKAKPAGEARELALLAEERIDLVVLARYMQILSGHFIERFPGRIINIHHSFLPAFQGGKPYHQARERGVKLIGATAHYATSDLDEGPIIEQDVVRVTHRDAVDDLVRKGRDLEVAVLLT